MFAVTKIIDESLYAVKIITDRRQHPEAYECDDTREEEDEFERLFNNWADTAYLYNFFETHVEDLQSGYFGGKISIEEAVMRTLAEAAALEEKLLDLAEKGKMHRKIKLEQLFRPLFKRDQLVYPPPERQQSKAYGEGRRSWLRVYAIRIDENLYIITGGAIKLTEAMNTRPHLMAELAKLKQVREFLIEEQIIDLESLTEFLEIDL